MGNQAKQDMGATEAAKAADEKYLAQLKRECEETAAGWAQRQQSAKAEMEAINKAIEVLSEGVRVLLQTGTKRSTRRNNLDKYDKDFDEDSDSTDAQSTTSESTDSQSTDSDNASPGRKRIVDKLKSLSKKFGSYALMELAGSATSDPFVKIRGLIEDMIEKLLKEAQEEATQKAFCDEEMGKSKKAQEQKTMTLEKLQTRIVKATSTIDQLTEDVKTLEAEIADIDKAQSEATKIRTKENADNTAAIKDFR